MTILNNHTVPPPGTKILFACFPADGHFNPLTGLAVHLMNLGCDVRWYTSKYFVHRLRKLGIPYFLFDKAKDIDITRVDDEFPARTGMGKIKKLNYDIINLFVNRSAEYYEDVKAVHERFAFDIVVADIAFTAIPFITEKLNVPVVSVGIAPMGQSSKDLAPNGLGMVPSTTLTGKLKQAFLRFVANKVLFAPMTKAFHAILNQYRIDTENLSVFDINYRKSTRVLQIGSPGFDYKRSDLAENITFVGALLPYSSQKTKPWTHEKLSRYQKVVLVTQGTVEKDITKLIVPSLEAFKGSNVLLVVTTGGSNTEELRNYYPHDNIIIEDFIPFADVMPYADVYITNGGYGGTLLSITHGLPLIAAGVHEGKNEITARIGYFKIGINLKTETPSSSQLKTAVEDILQNDVYKKNVRKLSREMQQYKPLDACTQCIADVLESKVQNHVRVVERVQV